MPGLVVPGVRNIRLTGIALVLLVAAGCSSPAPTSATPANATKVEIRNFQFSPVLLEVARGTTVTWTNQDDILHTATAGTAIKKDDLGTYERKPTGAFDGRMASPGTSFSFTFAEPGEYAYFCDRHAHMTGKVVVR